VVPAPEEAKRLSIERAMIPADAFTVPDIIAHSTKIERYVAIRTQLADALCKAKVVSEKREWYPVSSIKKEYGPAVIWPDMLVNIGDRPEDIALIADARRISRPDLIIECIEQEDWYQQEGLDRIRLHHNVFKPVIGTYVVSRWPVPEEAYKELEPVSAQVKEPTPVEEPEKQAEGIRILTVGLDQSRLEPIIAALKPVEVNTGGPVGQ
jgi:hypothetical protein